jgi:hypothetical protein
MVCEIVVSPVGVVDPRSAALPPPWTGLLTVLAAPDALQFDSPDSKSPLSTAAAVPFTVKRYVALWWAAPAVALTASEYVPGGVVAAVVIVTWVVVPTVTEFGANDADASEGRPATAKLSVPGTPDTTVVLAVKVSCDPAVTGPEAAESASRNSAAAGEADGDVREADGDGVRPDGETLAVGEALTSKSAVEFGTGMGAGPRFFGSTPAVLPVRGCEVTTTRVQTRPIATTAIPAIHQIPSGPWL